MPRLPAIVARLHPLQRVALGVWAALLLGVAGRVIVAPARSHTVLPIYLTAAERWERGETLYGAYWPLDVYRNPPVVAAAFVPLRYVPEKVAGLGWRALSAAVFLVGLGAWVKRGLPRPLTPAETGAVFALAALPCIPSLNNGQTNLILAGAMLRGATAAVGGRGGAAGTWLAAAAAVKVYPLAVGMLVAAARPLKVGPWLVAAFVAIAAVPFLLRDPTYVVTEYENFCASVSADDRTFADLGRAPQDLFLFLRVWVGPPPTAAYAALKFGAAAAMAGLVVLAARRTGRAAVAVPLAFNLGCVWITVFGPATEVHTYTMLAPTAALAVVVGITDRRGWGRAVLAVIGYGLIVFPIVRDMLPNGKPVHALALPALGGLFVLAAVVWQGAHDARTRPARGSGSGAAKVVVYRRVRGAPARAAAGTVEPTGGDGGWRTDTDSSAPARAA